MDEGSLSLSSLSLSEGYCSNCSTLMTRSALRQRSALDHTLATMGSQDAVRRNRRVGRALRKLAAVTKGWLVRLEIAINNRLVNRYHRPHHDKVILGVGPPREPPHIGRVWYSQVWRRNTSAVHGARWRYRNTRYRGTDELGKVRKFA